MHDIYRIVWKHKEFYVDAELSYEELRAFIAECMYTDIDFMFTHDVRVQENDVVEGRDRFVKMHTVEASVQARFVEAFRKAVTRYVKPSEKSQLSRVKEALGVEVTA